MKAIQQPSHTTRDRRRAHAVRAWVAEGRVSRDRRRVRGRGRPALVMFAISVHDSMSTAIDERLRLISDVAARFSRRVPSGVPSVWVFPGGYFGFNAAAQAWRRFGADALREIEKGIRRRALHYPIGSLIAVGVDNAAAQQAWVVRRGRRDIAISRITRGVSPLPARRFTAGWADVAFFVCGEFTGSYTYQNGPFCRDGNGRTSYLDDRLKQLRGCDVLVDLAHQKVSGSISGRCSPRMVHRRQMERFSHRGVAVLTHHHAGLLLDDRRHFKHQSNWIVFRNARWLPEAAVNEIS